MWLYYLIVIYILFSAGWFFLFKNTDKEKLLYIVTSMGLLAFLAMFRSVDVGNDTATYIDLFYKISVSSEIAVFADRYEFGYLLLNKILSYISNNHQILLIITSAYIFFIVGRFIYKHSNMVWLSVFLFFSLYFDLSMSGIRQMLAIATIVLSYEYIVAKKPFKFILTVLVASLFHTSALAFFAAYPLSKLKLSKKLVIMISLATITGYLFFSFVLDQLLALFPQYSYYLGGTYLDGEFRLGTLAGLLVILTILVVSEICNRRAYYRKRDSGGKHLEIVSMKKREDEIQSIFTLIGCAIMVISLKGTILSRFGDIYGFFSIIYLPNSIKRLAKDSRILLVLFTILMFFAYSTIVQIYRPEWQSSYPYYFYWS